MILITEFMDLNAVKKLQQEFEVLYKPELADTQNKIPSFLKNIKALIVRNRTKVNCDLLNNGPNILCIGRLGVGLDNIDIEVCKKKNISVYPAIGANTRSVVEYVITSSMILLRGAYKYKPEMINGEWPRQNANGNEVLGKTIGLIGFGEIAQETNKIAQLFGMKTQAYDPFINENNDLWKQTKKVELDYLLQTSDIISLHIPLTDKTYHLIDKEKLNLIKPNSVIINASRGGTIDEVELCKKLKEKKILGAALDVFEDEPLKKSKSVIFENIENLILTPHIAGVTKEANVRVSDMIANLVATHLKKEVN